jgi:hypothetical protein
MARPKYQIFISSTFRDLQEERKAVTWALLSARHIPAGMENFTPSDDRGWKTILSVIDKSDYYILILAGQYGSLDTDGLSWTEREYDYAVLKKIPVLAFIREKSHIPASLFDTDLDISRKRDEFHSKVMNKHLCGKWQKHEDLVSLVTRALDNHIKDDEDAGQGRPGWYRGDEIPSNNVLDEFARLSQENAELKAKLSQHYQVLFHGSTFDELRSQMEIEYVEFPKGERDYRFLNLWDFFLRNAIRISQRQISTQSQLSEYCRLLQTYNLVDEVNNAGLYGFTDLGHKLFAQIRKLGLDQ